MNRCRQYSTRLKIRSPVTAANRNERRLKDSQDGTRLRKVYIIMLGMMGTTYHLA